MIRSHIRGHSHSHMDIYNDTIAPFDFKPEGAETGGIDISLPADKSITIEWGDGNKTDISGPVDNQNYTNAYVGAGTFSVTFKGDYESVTRLDINTVNCDSTISRLGKLAGLTYLYCTSSNTISGDIANLPIGLIAFYCTGSNTISGDIANLPTGLVYFYCIGSNILSGDIANLPTGLVTCTCFGSNTVLGDIANLPIGLTKFDWRGSNTISDYSGKNWTTRPATFYLKPTGVGGLSTAEIDQLLIDFDDDLVWSGGSITLTGTNAARSAASDVAVTNLESEGVTVTTTV